MPWLAVTHTLEEDDRWVTEVLLPGSDVWVAHSAADSDDVIAVISLTPGWIDQLYVAPAEQGSGLGSSLLRRAQRAASTPLRLWAFQRNTNARRFYERHGFIEVAHTEGENEEREPDVLYLWEPIPALPIDSELTG